MPKQFEHDVTANMAAAKEALGDGTFGGGQIEHFRKGWAMDIWGGGKVHYWKRISIEAVESLCGLIAGAFWEDTNGKRHPRLHGGGDFPPCKNCMRTWLKRKGIEL